jgi:hypothetical protein
MNTPPPPPRERTRCEYHNQPLQYAGTFDNEHVYECPAPRCSVTVWYSADPKPIQSSHGQEPTKEP